MRWEKGNGNNQNANISIIADPNKLPNFDLEFDGIPKPDFLRQFWRSFENNLGTIVQDGYTLLDCLNQDDAGAGQRYNRVDKEKEAKERRSES